jgi:hypothetical protein
MKIPKYPDIATSLSNLAGLSLNLILDGMTITDK